MYSSFSEGFNSVLTSLDTLGPMRLGPREVCTPTFALSRHVKRICSILGSLSCRMSPVSGELCWAVEYLVCSGSCQHHPWQPLSSRSSPEPQGWVLLSTLPSAYTLLPWSLSWLFVVHKTVVMYKEVKWLWSGGSVSCCLQPCAGCAVG